MRILKVLFISLIAMVIALCTTVESWQDTTNIRISFKSECNKDLGYQIFYTDTEKGNFNEKQSFRQKVPAGVQNIEIILPTTKVAKLRIDFGAYPETVIVSDMKLIGDKTINILADEEEQYGFSVHIEEHQFIDGKALRIVSNQSDPYMVYKQNLNVTPEIVINRTKLLQIALGTFVIAFILGLVLTRKKKSKTEEKTQQKQKSKK